MIFSTQTLTLLGNMPEKSKFMLHSSNVDIETKCNEASILISKQKFLRRSEANSAYSRTYIDRNEATSAYSKCNEDQSESNSAYSRTLEDRREATSAYSRYTTNLTIAMSFGTEIS
jgi:hypothetical protein